MQKFPLRMKERYHSRDCVTALSVYLAPTTALSGKCIEIAYWTISGAAQMILQQPEVMFSTKHCVSVCSEYNHVHSWNVT
ncbi:hypothetical protein LSAT2_008664 [Lamellibrachia satsuma]|nr:hypothetical protein LSAT2_008664 [Lamellibrachia satsuma]